ncbi:RloB domain-containing protein [Brasilonema octagenarum UFV-E1]|uniref:RloB domain-containing protein n=2 Tax=Brasilonema TaxID=383614 RepID=A0A856MDM2_9CYAN|nr:MULTISPECIES: RloB family protein [Brasilonema]NMF67311.1 RloB domain-containing protein [Brasilonema octagenarum UFV-OR1]QDL09283.1 RloB domain-containing protein [Brasilonema sennae CENA114]QDL15640.1 RloB domain-containing protein [Brasilonema octagenarum UFV-E1]
MPRKKENSRGYHQRKVNTREIRQRFLIICEGEKTEPNYFRSFRVSKNVAEVNVHGLGKNPSKLVKSANELNNQDDYDQVWCVFDRDSWTVEDFNNTIKNAETQGFKVACSNEAFELWYVLHFEFLNTGIPRNDYKKKLTYLLGRPYNKNSDTIYDELFEKQSIAIKNAKKLLKQYEPHNPEKDNPSTTVHLLVQELKKFMQ